MTGPNSGQDPPISSIQSETDWIWNPAGSLSTTVEKSDKSIYVQKKYSLAFEKMIIENANGVVMNKLLAWMDVQQDTIPPDTWKAHLKTLYTDDEIIDAKVALFEVVGGETSAIGTFKKHHIKQKHITVGQKGF